MKSFLSILITLVIIIIFAGSAYLLWYGSKTTEFRKGPDADTIGN